MKWILMACLIAAGLPWRQAAVATIGERVWAKPDHFWWRRSVPGGNLWLTVDAKHGARTPLFDHQRLAIELSLRSGHEFTPLTLPFADPAARFVVKYDGSNAYIQEGAMAVEFVRPARRRRHLEDAHHRRYEPRRVRSGFDTLVGRLAPADRLPPERRHLGIRGRQRECAEMDPAPHLTGSVACRRSAPACQRAPC